MTIDRRINSSKQSRRGLLQMGWRSAAAVLALGGTQLKASSSSAGRVLVNLQLAGGHDSNSMIIPLDDAPYARYRSARGSLAIARGQLLPVTAPRLSGANFGLHPALVELHDMYQRKALGVVANVGPAERAQAANISDEMVYILGGFTTPKWATGMLGFMKYFDIQDKAFTFSSGVTMISSHTAGEATHAARYNQPALLNAMHGAPIRTIFPSTTLGRNLKQVVQLIHAAPTVGASNPVILASHGTFGPQPDQLRLYSDLDASLGAFERALAEIGAAQRVTLYTQTEFNRTLLPNAQGGFEQAWGGHQLVLGHSVMGGDVYGTFPSMELGASDDADGKGTWIPSTTNDQYHATLASWLGVGLERMHTVFPGLSRSAVQDLRFVV